MKTGIGSGIEFQPETEIRCIFVFSVLGYNEDFIKKKQSDYNSLLIMSESSIKYYPFGELAYEDMLKELKKANKFIFLEYFIKFGTIETAADFI